jgi:small subunit ribosomal protein S10
MKFRIILKSFKKDLINDALKMFQKNILEENQTQIIQSIVSLPVKIKKFCVLRSPHIDKNSREHFEIRIYKKFIDLKLESFLFLEKLLKLQIDSGVSCIIKTFN